MASYAKRGSKWRAQVRRKGQSISRTFYTKAEARAWAIQKESEIDRGRAFVSTVKTLRDAFTRYAEEVSPTKRGERWEVVRLNKLSKDELAGIRLSNLTPDALNDWKQKRARVASHATVNRELTLIRSVLKQARVIWEWMGHDPLANVKRFPSPPHRDRRISQDEIDRICLALGYEGGKPKNQSQQVAVMFLLAIETGMRLGELCGLQPGHVYPRFVRLQSTKNRDRRDVPLSRRASQLISLLGIPCVSSSVASQLFRKARIRAEIDDLTFHDSRHEACTRLARKLDVLDLARMLGMRDPRTLMIYYNSSADEIARRLDAD